MTGENAGAKHPREEEEEDASGGGGPLSVAEADAMVEKMARRLAELEAESKALAGAWRERHAEVLDAVRHSDEKLSDRSAAIARERYGEADAGMYSPEPPAITSLVVLSTRADDELAFVEKVERFTCAGGACKKMLLGALYDVKARLASGDGDRESLRHLGGCLNAINKTMRTGRELDRVVGKRITAAMKRLTRYRTASRVREVHPERLVAIPASSDGYRKILDFYRLSCASAYSFGRQLEGPQHFVDIRRNVAVLTVERVNASDASVVYNNWAISGESSVGANLPPCPSARFFDSISCVDGLGEVYDRALDAEYKLITEFMVTKFAKGEGYRAVLWSKKPLCDSCAGVLLRQLPERYPSIALTVLIDGEEKAEEEARN